MASFISNSFLQIADSSLQDFQYEGIDYLYNLEPQQLNLFKVTDFYDPVDSTKDGYAGTNGGSTSSGGIIPEKMSYRIKSITGISIPKLTIDDSLFKKSTLRINLVSTGRTEQNRITINWHEDAYLTVRRYHMNWMNHWYNRYLDCMVCGQVGKYRNMIAYLFHYVNKNKTSASPILVASPIAKFEWLGLIPEGPNPLSLDAGNPANEQTVDISYRYNVLGITFYAYEKDDKEFIGGMASAVQNDTNSQEIGALKNTGIDGKNVESLHKYTYFI